ncbi:MAG TPA: hypothetical protein VKR21_01230 [Solirubrobacteraceae bacterium]|nr:hypothetical protein [Solirubrobacteraceae bacterium]
MFEAFNGQQARRRVVQALIEQFEPDGFIETGTFLASTTRFFAGNNVPVYSAEINRLHWLLARLRLGWRSGVRLVYGDSRDMLDRLAAERPFRRPLAYLDAHWGEDHPLRDELARLCQHWSEVLIVVDDFAVDDDRGYSHDAGLSLAEVRLPASVAVAVPATPSSSETGARRGALYLAHGENAKLAVREVMRRGLLREPASGRDEAPLPPTPGPGRGSVQRASDRSA